MTLRLKTKSGAALKRFTPTKRSSGSRPSPLVPKAKVPKPDPTLTGTQKRGFGVLRRGPGGA